MRRLTALAVTAAVAALVFAVSMIPQMGAASSSSDDKVVKFDLMAPVVEPFTGGHQIEHERKVS